MVATKSDSTWRAGRRARTRGVDAKEPRMTLQAKCPTTRMQGAGSSVPNPRASRVFQFSHFLILNHRVRDSVLHVS